MYDYVIVGEGSAECVPADRLWADPDASVVAPAKPGHVNTPTIMIVERAADLVAAA